MLVLARGATRGWGSASSFALVGLLGGCPPDPEPEPESAWEVGYELDASQGALLSVWGDGPDDVRAVGGQVSAVGDPGVGIVLARDSDDWTPEPLPPDAPLLNWIHGAEGSVWTVGNAGAALRLEGGTWIADNTPVDVPLWGVWVLSATEAWAVGGDAFDSMGTGVLVHYANGAWQEVELPALDRPAPAIFKVWGTSPANMVAVGDNGVILHYDGATWVQVPSGTTEDLISMWGTGPDDILAVGGRSNGVVARFDGSAWTSTTLTIPALNGVWMDADGDALIVGARGSVSEVLAGEMDAEIVETPARLDVMHAVFGAGDERFVVGGTLENPPPYTGVILQRR